MTLGVTVSIIHNGERRTVTVEEVYHTARANVPSIVIVSMTVPNLRGLTASPVLGPYAIDTFKVPTSSPSFARSLLIRTHLLRGRGQGAVPCHPH